VKKIQKVKIYSALEVANICGVVNQTAINWIKKEYLKAFSTPGGQYRVYGEDLANFMSSRGMKVPAELKIFLLKESKTVLMIEEDDQFARQFFDEIQAEYPGCSIERAVDSFEAGRKLTLESRDLVLINNDIKGLDVEKVCRTIRSESGGDSKSIIVFTGLVDNIKKEMLLDAGADVYLKKPFDIGQISIYLE